MTGRLVLSNRRPAILILVLTRDCYYVIIEIPIEKGSLKMFVRFRLTFTYVPTGETVRMFFRSKEEAEKAILIRKSKRPHDFADFQITPMILK